MKKKKKSKVPVPAVPKSGFGSTWLPHPRMYADMFRLEAEQLAQLHDDVVTQSAAASAAISSDWKRVIGEADEDDDDAREYLDSLHGETKAIEARERWSALLHCVALYHYLERELGSVFKWVFSGLPDSERENQLRRVHKWSDLAILADAHLGITVSAVDRFDDVDRLRLICNAVKHTGGKVSSELARKTGWASGSPIEPVMLDLCALRKAGELFLEDFVARANAGLQTRLGPPP